jgi:hypothetical protein
MMEDELPEDGGQPLKMTEAELAGIIDRESSNAIGWTDELTTARQRNLEYYLGEAVGDLAPPEVEGRSKVVSRDVLDTVEWTMPALMRMFAGSDEVVRFEPEAPEDQQGADDATAYVGYLIHRKNNGFLLLHDAIKSALISRMGVVKCYCDYRWEVREERYTGVSQIEREQLAADPEVEIIAEQPVGMAEPPPGIQLPPELLTLYDVTVRRKRRIAQLKAEGCPPEEIRIAKDARSIEDVRFIAHVVERTVSDLKSLGYDPALVDSLSDDSGLSRDGERLARHDYDGSWDWKDPPEPSQRRVTLTEAYLRVDFDGDGIAEYRRVVKAGTVVFENDIVDDHPFTLFCPILMPYKVIGLSVADLVMDLQEIKTALTRQVLDNVYLANTPMREAVEGQVNLDDLLSPRPGGVVRVKQLNATRDLTTPFVAGAGLQLIDHFNQVRDQRTGVTDFNQGLNPESLSKTNVGSMGVEALLNAGAQRIELLARVFAETGIKRLYLLMLKLAQQNVDRVQQVKINGRWMMIDPRAWKHRYDMEVSVGIGTASRQQQVVNLQLILTLIEKAAQYGLATPANAYKALTRLTEAMGYRDSDQFFTAPNPMQPPAGGGQQQDDDAQTAAAALIQAEQIKAQAAQQRAEMDNAIKLQVEKMRIESSERIAQLRAETDLLKQHMAKIGDSLNDIRGALGLVHIGGVQ